MAPAFPHPVESFVHAGGARLYVKRWPVATDPRAAAGGPTLVLLHDSLGSVRIWRDLPDRLREATGLPVLAYDRQGYGDSDPVTVARRAKTYLDAEARILFEVLDACGVGKAALIGHSDGGTIAVLAAAADGRAAAHGTSPRAPRIAGMVFEAGHVFIEPLTVKGIGDALETYRTTDLEARLEKYHGPKAEALVRLWTESWLSEEFRAWNITGVLPDIRCPTLVIQGEDDEYATLAQVEAVARGVRGPVRELVLPGIGHVPHREAPEAVVAAMADFLRMLPA